MTAPAHWSRLRLRQSPIIRDLLSETTFGTAQFIQPMFIVDGLDLPQDVPGLPDIRRLPLQSALPDVAAGLAEGVRQVLLFAIPAAKSADAIDPRAIVEPVRALKREYGDALWLWTDICLCAHTTHGHCAVLDGTGRIDLPRTLDRLAELAVAAADAGADGVAPSDMMDGRTRAIRAALDAAGHQRVPIMSYSTKFASVFYGPFRGAADSAPQFGDRRHYQIDVRSRRDALASSVRCADEGADLLMVKPGLSSADLIAPIAQATGLPVGAYQVSGEYAALAALADRGFLDFDAGLVETWHVLRRAGAAFIISYGARRARALGFGA